VHLDGDGFTLLATEGDEVLTGAPIVSWDPGSVAARGFSPICPVIALDATDDLLANRFNAGAVDVGDPLFSWN
jgi:sugar PTS system EIIA component